jgi:hypothetical protein
MPGWSRAQALAQAGRASLLGAPAVGSGGVGAPLASGYGSTGSLTSGPLGYPGKAPTPTAFADFTAPLPGSFDHSPDYQYLQDEQAKATQRSAAARGTLLNTGTSKQLQRDAAGIAAGDFQNAFDRATTAYGLNRGTNAQNYGQRMDEFRGNLDAFNTGDASALNWAKYGQSERDRAPGPVAAAPLVTGPGLDTYAQYVAAQRAPLQPQQAPILPLAPTKTTFRQREYRGAGQ